MKQFLWNKLFIIGFLTGILFILSGCASTDSNPLTYQDTLFDTVIQIRIYDANADEALDACKTACKTYENLFSRTVEGSDIYRLNHANGSPTELSDETITLLKLALQYCELSDGAFDVTLAPLSDLWNFQDNSGVLPDNTAIVEALSHVGYKNVMITGNTVQLLDAQTEIDLGGIAKGYIADQLKAILKEHNVEHALIDLGGNILALGGKPDGTAFRIGIQKPFSLSGEAMTYVETTNQSVVSSGVYQRYFELDGTIYHHIVNPRTGYPYQNHLYGVTILSDSSADADALSTTCFALGPEEGMKLINSLDYAEALFITDEYELLYSNNFPKNK